MGENNYKTYLMRGKYSKICKGLKQVNIRKANTQIHTVEREWTFLESRHAAVELSRYSTPLIHQKYQRHTNRRRQALPVKMAFIKKMGQIQYFSSFSALKATDCPSSSLGSQEGLCCGQSVASML